jgi:hypothetical protein
MLFKTLGPVTRTRNRAIFFEESREYFEESREFFEESREFFLGIVWVSEESREFFEESRDFF